MFLMYKKSYDGPINITQMTTTEKFLRYNLQANPCIGVYRFAAGGWSWEWGWGRMSRCIRQAYAHISWYIIQYRFKVIVVYKSTFIRISGVAGEGAEETVPHISAFFVGGGGKQKAPYKYINFAPSPLLEILAVGY